MLEKFRKHGRIDKSALAIPTAQPPASIDKSALALGEPPRVRDKAYRDTAPQRACEVCDLPGATGRVVAAHPRAGQTAGTSIKPSDDLVVFLCDEHHADQEANPGAWWWYWHVFLPWRRRLYCAWKALQSQSPLRSTATNTEPKGGA